MLQSLLAIILAFSSILAHDPRRRRGSCISCRGRHLRPVRPENESCTDTPVPTPMPSPTCTDHRRDSHHHHHGHHSATCDSSTATVIPSTTPCPSTPIPTPKPTSASIEPICIAPIHSGCHKDPNMIDIYENCGCGNITMSDHHTATSGSGSSHSTHVTSHTSHSHTSSSGNGGSNSSGSPSSISNAIGLTVCAAFIMGLMI